MSRVKGSKISLKTAFVKQHYGDEKLSELIDSMPPADQLALKMILDTAWYPIDLYHRLVIAICQVTAGGDESIYAAVGHHSARLSLDSVYKVFKARSPIAVLNNMIPLHSMMNDPGEMRVTPIGDTQCIVEVLQPPSIPEVCKVAQAFYQASVEVTGAQDVQVRHTACSGKRDPLCRFEISWRMPSQN